MVGLLRLLFSSGSEFTIFGSLRRDGFLGARMPAQRVKPVGVPANGPFHMEFDS